MALRTLSSPTAPAGGTTLTFTVSGGTWTTITVDPTKFTIQATSAGFDSTGTATSTVRTFTAVTATHSAGTITIETSEPFFTGDTSVTVAVTEGGLDDGTDQNAALTTTAVTNNSTLAVPLVCGLQFVNPAHQRHTTTIPIELTCLHRFGIAAVRFGITYRSVVTTTAAGITGTGVYPSAVTFSGGATGRIAPGSTLTGAGSARTVHVFIESGTVANGETGTITNGSATFTVDSVAGGGQTTSTQTAMSTVNRAGSYGPAPTYDLWRAELTPPSVGVYQRWAIVFPSVGASFDTRSRTRHNTAGTEVDGQCCIGEDETYGDPGDTEASLQKSYYVDSTSSAACGASTVAAFQPFEFCAVRTAGVLSAVVLAIGNTADGTQAVGSTSFRYNALMDQVTVHTMTLAADPTGGNPVPGNFFTLTTTYTNTHPVGLVLAYDSGTRLLTYLKTVNAAFTAGQAVRCLDASATATGVTFTAAAPSAAVGTTVSNGDVVTGFFSGATCTLSGAPAANGNNSNAGTIGAPFATMLRAMRTATTDRGDSLCDGATVYLLPGTHRQSYSFSLAAESRFYWVTYTPAPGVSRDLVRIVKWDPSNANAHFTNFQRYFNVTLWNVWGSAGTRILVSNNAVQGLYKAASIWFDTCYALHEFRWHRSSVCSPVPTSSGFNYTVSTNCNGLRISLPTILIRDTYIENAPDSMMTKTFAAVNLDCDRSDARGTDNHADMLLLQTTEGGNRMVWNFRTRNNGFFQAAPFINCPGANPPSRLAFVNMLQAADDGANIGSLTVSSGTASQSDWIWVNCSTEDTWAFDPTSAGRTLNISNLYMIDSVWANIQRTAAGTTNGLAACWFVNQHRIANSGSTVPAGYLTTTGSTLTDLVVSLDDNAADFFAPKTGGLLLNRASTRPNGFPRRDVLGRLLSTDGTARASVGAVQPIATLTATVDGNAITSGGSAAASGTTGGSTTLVFTVGGPTGAVLVVDAGSVAGGLSSMVPPSLPRTLTSGGSTTTATFTATLGSSPGTFNVGMDLLADFTGTVTWSSLSDYPFRARAGGSFRNPTGGIRRR